MVSQKVRFPLPWREGIKGRGKYMDANLFYSPSPWPSPFKGEGTIGLVTRPPINYINQENENLKDFLPDEVNDNSSIPKSLNS